MWYDLAVPRGSGWWWWWWSLEIISRTIDYKFAISIADKFGLQRRENELGYFFFCRFRLRLGFWVWDIFEGKKGVKTIVFVWRRGKNGAMVNGETDKIKIIYDDYIDTHVWQFLFFFWMLKLCDKWATVSYFSLDLGLDKFYQSLRFMIL